MNPLETLAQAGLQCFLLPNDVLWVTPRHAITPALRVFIQQHKTELLEALSVAEWNEERAAILEFDAGMVRPQAEASALAMYRSTKLH